MAQHQTGAALNTPDLLTGKSRLGRPVKSDSLTGAQRQAQYRAERIQCKLGAGMVSTVQELASLFDLSQDDVMRELVRFALTNRNWKNTGF